MKELIPALLLLFATHVLAGSAGAQLPEKFIVRPEGGPPSTQPWSPGVLVGNTLYLSGQGGRRRDGIWPSAMEGEIGQCFENIRRILLAAGMDYSNVVSAYVFLEDLSHYEALNRLFRERFPRNPPVRSTMEVGRIPGPARIVVQTIAVQDGTPREYVSPPLAWSNTDSWPFSAAIKVNGILYLSGLGTADMHTGQQPETYKLQVKQSLVSLGELLGVAGMDYRHVVFVNPYLSPPGDWAPLNVVYRQFFEFGHTPARATLTIQRIPGANSMEISAVAVEDLSRRQVVRPINRRQSPTANPAVFAGDVLYFAGLSGFTPGQGRIVEDFEAKIRFAMRNIQDCLETAEMTFENIVNVNAYLGNAEDYQRMLKVYSGFFPDDPPALTVIQQSPTGPNNQPVVQFSAIAIRSVTAREANP